MERAEQIVKRELKAVVHELSTWIGNSDFTLPEKLKMRAGLSWFTRKMRHIQSSEGWGKMKELMGDLDNFVHDRPTKVPLAQMISDAAKDPDMREFFEDVGVDPENINVDEVRTTLKGVWDASFTQVFNRFYQTCDRVENALKTEGY